jgi:hypothetical protein
MSGEASVVFDRLRWRAVLPARAGRRRRLVRVVLLLASVLVAGPLMSRSEAVVNGQVVSNAPSWVVGLVGSTEGLCSGVLIAPALVLSAAHCQESTLKGDVTAVIGRSDLLNTSQGSLARVTGVTFHPGEDLAVYALSTAVTQAPIPISASDIGPGSGNIPFFVMGYGVQSEPGQPLKNDFLLRGVVGLVTPCAGSGRGWIPEPKKCLGSAKIGAPCLGDSGAPITNPSHELAGILVAISGIISGQPICDGSQWVVEPMGDQGVRDWVTQQIQKSKGTAG